MLNNMIPQPELVTVFTGRDESLADLQQLPELQDKQIVGMEQVHGNQVDTVTYANSTPTEIVQIPGADALITQNRNLALVVRVADCVPILLYHKPSQTIGVIHAGRKGTELGITEKVLRQLASIEGPLYLWLGPHICDQCYQINREANEHYNLLRKNLNQMYNVFAKDQLRLAFDLHCTAHHNKQFYSYRQEGVGVPMNYGVISFNHEASL